MEDFLFGKEGRWREPPRVSLPHPRGTLEWNDRSNFTFHLAFFSIGSTNTHFSISYMRCTHASITNWLWFSLFSRYYRLENPRNDIRGFLIYARSRHPRRQGRLFLQRNWGYGWEETSNMFHMNTHQVIPLAVLHSAANALTQIWYPA